MTPINLQVCIPYQKCPFKCPMCIASSAPHFNNLYKKDKQKYFDHLCDALLSTNGKYGKIATVVLTGDTEPTLDYGWMKEVINYIKLTNCRINVELQTHVYQDHRELCEGLDPQFLNRICYSITTVQDIINFTKRFPTYMPSKSRVVILATEEVLKYLDEHNVNFECDQITFKLLQYTAYNQEDKDTYITEHRLTADDKRLQKLVLQYSTTSFNRSVVVDTNCQDAKGRYKIFREDGNVYSAWDKLKPEYLEE